MATSRWQHPDGNVWQRADGAPQTLLLRRTMRDAAGSRTVTLKRCAAKTFASAPHVSIASRSALRGMIAPGDRALLEGGGKPMRWHRAIHAARTAAVVALLFGTWAGPDGHAAGSAAQRAVDEAKKFA